MAIIKKSAFARQIGVDPSRVTQYLKSGLIDGPAIVGEGRGAMINSDVACAQLKERLNSDQVHGENGLWTRLDGQPGNLDAVKGAIALEKLEHARTRDTKIGVRRKVSRWRIHPRRRSEGRNRPQHAANEDVLLHDARLPGETRSPPRSRPRRRRCDGKTYTTCLRPGTAPPTPRNSVSRYTLAELQIPSG